ncbi:serine/threonine-protein kinase [Dysgonomonas sp. 520]|uniref:serine/threonine-protein kinase n=1 Tax=Dysgonomonas sp. 520 TaxID=2302931 RepID=UPI0013D1DBC5|nr:serine/threonine-protein kinase [Dysgonomonas sp. 520]NDW11229.1 serine/threonine protein kinase [Dysgonomonas sp. 520]
MENSSFGEATDKPIITNIQQLNNGGATSDTYKVFINEKWNFLKRPKKEFASHPHYLKAFEKEYEIGSSLKHPNIVNYIEKGVDNEGFYILTEYIDGGTLKDFVDENPDYFHNKKNLRKFIFQLLSALDYLHERQILHLDLKPDNILITRIGHDVKIVDLGFAYNDSHQYLTVGKSEKYAAPEQIENNNDIDQRADIYSLGILVLFAYTRTHNKQLIDKLPNPYKNCVKKCLEVDKENRFDSISSIRDYFSQKSRQKKILFSSITLLMLIILGLAVQLAIPKKATVLDISEMDAPHDIMQKVTTDTSLDYIKQQFGEPKEIDSYNDPKRFIYHWYFKNLKLSLREMCHNDLHPYSPPIEPDKMINAEITYELMGDADLIYDDIFSNFELSNLGKATIGDYIDKYFYKLEDGSIHYGGDKLYINVGRYRENTNSFKIFMNGSAPTNYQDYILCAEGWFLTDLDKSLQDKLIKSEGDVSILNRSERQQILDVVRKLKITSISSGSNLEEFYIY